MNDFRQRSIHTLVAGGANLFTWTINHNVLFFDMHWLADICSQEVHKIKAPLSDFCFGFTEFKLLSVAKKVIYLLFNLLGKRKRPNDANNKIIPVTYIYNS